jgi:sugar phosphate isomerase/epimerase
MMREEMSRRDFLATTSAAAAGVGLMGCTTSAKTKRIPVAVQLYSVRTECEKDFPATIKAVADMGFEGVEFAGYFNHQAAELRGLLDDNGLKCAGTHTQLNTLMGDELPKTLEYNQTLGNKNIIVPWLAEDMRDSKEAWLKTVDLFNELNEKVKPHGMRMGYHNHTFEFQPLEDGQTPWDLIFSNTPKEFIMQIDTCNAMMGGADPLVYLKKYPGRAISIHLKEFSATNKNAILGEGDVDWQQVFEICETTGGTEWYIIEEEKDVYPPLQGVEMCLKNLRKLKA